MYKYLIVGLTLIIIIFSGYYMFRSGGGELIANALSGGEQVSMRAPTVENVVGIYKCDESSGCDDRYIMLLRDDQTLELLAATSTGDDGDSFKFAESEPEAAQKIERTSIVADVVPEDQSILQDVDSATTTDEAASSTENGADNTTQETSLPSSSNEEEITFGNVSSLADIASEDKAPVEKGTWSFGTGNIIIITLTGEGEREYEVPQKLIIKRVGASTLSEISYNRDRYPFMVKPVFVKQG